MTTIVVPQSTGRVKPPQVTNIVTETIYAPARTVFSVATDLENLPKVFRGFGPIPGIQRAWMQDGGAMREGGIRMVENSDGSIIDEEIITLIRPLRMQYRLRSGFAFPFSLLVSGAVSDWAFTQRSNGDTRITWRVTFETRSRLAYPFVWLILRLFFVRAQADCLKRIKALVECSGCPVPENTV